MILILPTVNHPKYIGSKHNLSKVVGHKLYWYFLFREFTVYYIHTVNSFSPKVGYFSWPTFQIQSPKIVPKKHPYIPIPHDFSGTNSLRPKSCSPWPVCLAPLSWRMPFLAVGCTTGIFGKGFPAESKGWNIMGDQSRAWVSRYIYIYCTMYVRVKIMCTLHPNFNKWVCWFLFVILHRINLFDELFGHCRFGAIGLSI